MPANVGSQKVSLLYHVNARSREVNLRHKGIRQIGIYSGGYLTVVDAANASLSTLICEISDSSYQVKIETQATVTIAVASATPYVVLRWAYTGSETLDFMDFKAVASPSTNDLVVGKCTFTGGGNLQGFDYSERSTPNVQDLFLKVEATEDTELRVRVRAGRISTCSGYIDISDQKTSLFTLPAANSKIYLVYVNMSTGAITIDSSGTAAASPVAPSYKGKLVLAEVTLSSTDTNITADDIQDVRSFLSRPIDVDDSTIEFDSNGKLAVKDPAADEYLVTLHESTQCDGQSSWTKLTLGSTIKRSGIDPVSSNEVTLDANKLYLITYSIIYESSTYVGQCQSRVAVVSGDGTWNLEESTHQYVIRTGTGQDDNHSTSASCIIKPSSETKIKLEAKTKGSTTFKSKVISVSLSVWTRG